MNEPLTTLDTRHSGPDAVVTPWEETRRVLETAELFWLATVRVDGRPHVTPCVPVWHDGAIHFTATDTAQKTVNLHGNPHVILTTGCNQIDSFHKQEGLSVVVEGDAVRITDQDTLERLASVWATKWEGGWPYRVRNGYFYLYDEDEQKVLADANLVFSVKPTKVFAVAIGHSQTRHQLHKCRIFSFFLPGSGYSCTTTRACARPKRRPCGQRTGIASQLDPASVERNTPLLFEA